MRLSLDDRLSIVRTISILQGVLNDGNVPDSNEDLPTPCEEDPDECNDDCPFWPCSRSEDYEED